jgi:FkbM family methyltransferase
MSGDKLKSTNETTLEDLEALLSEGVDAALQRERSAFDELASPFEERLVLFGAGGFGRRTLAGLRRVGIEPLAFADNDRRLWGSSVNGVRVVSPQDAAREFGRSAAFVVTIWNGQGSDRMADRIRQLTGLGCQKAMPAGFLFWKYAEVFLPYYPLDLPHKLLMRADEVRKVFHLCSDGASRREFLAQIAFRLLLDYDSLGSPGREEHYFPKDLFSLSPNEVLVDCGAFDGDTILSFVRQQGVEFSRILAFEPDPLNWPKLQETVAALPDNVRGKVTCSKQAVGAHTGKVQFDSTGTDLSATGAGAISVECVTLDDALKSHTPTMIKFDIEGAELDALAGGRRTIKQNLPLLAVSTYHQQSHLWEIPLAIADVSTQYNYALRPHGVEGWDLVWYALPPNRRRAVT